MIDFLLDEPVDRRRVVEQGDGQGQGGARDARRRRSPASTPLDAVGGATAIRAAIEAAAVAAGLVNAEGKPQLSKAQGPVRVAITGRPSARRCSSRSRPSGRRARWRACGPRGSACDQGAGPARGRRRRACWPSPRSPAPSAAALAAPALRTVWSCSLLLVAYVAVTFVQVWRASHHDGARAADAIIVLGAAQYNGRPSPVLQDRLDHALAALRRAACAEHDRRHRRPPGGGPLHRGDPGYNYLRDQGVPDEAILKEVDGTSTWESLAASARFLKDRDLDQVVLVTDGYHAYRVEAIAEDLGLDATVSPTDSGLSGTDQLRQLLRETAAVEADRDRPRPRRSPAGAGGAGRFPTGPSRSATPSRRGRCPRRSPPRGTRGSRR